MIVKFSRRFVDSSSLGGAGEDEGWPGWPLHPVLLPDVLGLQQLGEHGRGVHTPVPVIMGGYSSKNSLIFLIFAIMS